MSLSYGVEPIWAWFASLCSELEHVLKHRKQSKSYMLQLYAGAKIIKRAASWFKVRVYGQSFEADL